MPSTYKFILIAFIKFIFILKVTNFKSFDTENLIQGVSIAFKTCFIANNHLPRRLSYNNIVGFHTITKNVYPLNVIGIPKVAYRVPGTNHVEWEDIHNRLFRERILFISQELNDQYVNQLIASILCLDNESIEKPITLYINSHGGPMQAGLAFYDTLKHIKSKIVTINVGLCASTATLILGAGTPGKRFGLRHSRVLMLQPSGLTEGSAEQIKIEAKHILRIKKNLIQIYSDITKLPIERISADIERDNFMSVEECRDYGLIDNIVTNKDETTTS